MHSSTLPATAQKRLAAGEVEAADDEEVSAIWKASIASLDILHQTAGKELTLMQQGAYISSAPPTRPNSRALHAQLYLPPASALSMRSLRRMAHAPSQASAPLRAKTSMSMRSNASTQNTSAPLYNFVGF
jgi:hypothetical protein